jgi:hypothetical protein
MCPTPIRTGSKNTGFSAQKEILSPGLALATKSLTGGLKPMVLTENRSSSHSGKSTHTQKKNPAKFQWQRRFNQGVLWPSIKSFSVPRGLLRDPTFPKPLFVPIVNKN